MRYACGFCGAPANDEQRTCCDAGKAADKANPQHLAYPEFCMEPKLCAGRGYCPRDPCCCD